MNIISPNKKRSPAPWFALAFAALALLAVFVVRLMPRPGAGPETAAAKPDAEEETLLKLEGDINRLLISANLAEEVADRKKYMEIIEVAAEKNAQIDALLEKSPRQNARLGLSDGLADGFFETWRRPFTFDEKIRMLAERHGLPPEQIRRIKSQIEVLFLDELAAKIYPEEEPDMLN